MDKNKTIPPLSQTTVSSSNIADGLKAIDTDGIIGIIKQSLN